MKLIVYILSALLLLPQLRAQQAAEESVLRPLVAETVESPGSAEPQEQIMKAIPVERSSPAQFLPLQLVELPLTLPETVKNTFVRCEVDDPVVAITFDDGPHAEHTPRLLDMLAERNIRVTFFMVGQAVAAYPKIVKRMVEEGHEVANHTWSHPQLTGQSAAGVTSQLQKTHDAIKQASGAEALLYRPPYGATRLTQRRTIQETFGYPTILWDVDPLDWKSPRSAEKVKTRVLEQTRAGSIVLLHDIHKTTVDAMPETLDELIRRGFKMVTVTQLINLETAQQAAKLAAAEVIDLALPPTDGQENAPGIEVNPRKE
jgi:peptidoglycan/xylan/chitin deacetylase (PgdA/CDA1 family)